MITRTVEICKSCGQWDPWRVYATKMTGLAPGEIRRKYVRCRRCGKTEVISERLPVRKFT